MAKVTLIHPSNSFLKTPKMYFSLGLLYVAAVLEKAGHTVQIADLRDGNGFIPPASFYGVTATTSFEITHAYQIAEFLKFREPNCVTILGGHHALYFNEECARHFDVVVVGDGEKAILDIIDGGMRGIVQGGVTRDLDAVPFPARHLLPEEAVFSNALYEGEKYGVGPKATTIITSRGCPYSCAFCLPKGTLVLTSDLRWVPIENIVIGEKIIGVSPKNGKHTSLTESVVTHTFHRKAEILKIETENGTVYSTKEHPWLTHGNRWIKAERLTKNMCLRKVSPPLASSVETVNYKKGYIAGATQGDGYIGHYTQPCENHKYLHHRFRIASDEELMQTTLQYLKDFKINAYEAKFNSKGYPHITKCVRVDRKNDIYTIEKYITPISDLEYERGYLAGFYDAEGSCDGHSVRFYNKDNKLLDKTKEYLTHFGFKSVKEMRASETRSLRIIGGNSENIRFMALAHPKVVHKKFKLLKSTLHNRSKIVSVEKTGIVTDVYNLETSTENFVADGFVTHNCPQMKFIRFRSAKNVADEIKHLIGKYDCHNFRFVDDSFTIKRDRFFELCELFKPLNIHFRTQTRSDLLTPEMCVALKECGCEELGLGVESADDHVLEVVRKGETVEQHRAAVKMARDAGLTVKVNIMTGLPAETWATIEANKQFFREAKPDKYIHNVFCPFPGCDIWRNPAAYGVRILDTDYSKYYNFTESFIETDVASNRELNEHHAEMRRFLESGEWKQ